MSFVHLHVHSVYSLLDGAASVEGLCRRAVEHGSPALALTDHGAMYGAAAFYRTAQEHGLKPILGCELYLAPGSRTEKRAPGGREHRHHLLVLAQTAEGYRNLSRLVTAGFTEGFYQKPRIDRELLEAHAEGLIVLSGCMSSEVPELLLEGRDDEAVRVATWYRERFPGRYYVELQENGMPRQETLNRKLVALARQLDLPLVATSDVHYVAPEDAELQDALLCIQTGKRLADPDRLRFPTDRFYLKSPQEMEAHFAELPEALANTLRIAESVEPVLEPGRPELPDPPLLLQDGHPVVPERYLREEAERGARRRFGRLTRPVRERLHHELDVITSMGYAPYFLIVADFIAWARQQGIGVGPGRGSAASSLVAYALGITDIDPLRYGLVFERFLNPARVSMPDIDVDFSDARRGEVLEYVARRYGPDRVGQIATFSQLAARGALRDVGRLLDVPYPEVDRVAKLVPAAPGVTLKQALEQEPELAAMAGGDDPLRSRWIRLARAVEGAPRHLSVHAAGVVITREPLMHRVPLARTNEGVLVTQYPMEDLEWLGLLKMDFLGLRTLTVLERAVELANQERVEDGGPREPIRLESIPEEDPQVYRMLSEGKAEGVFQLETSMFRTLLPEVRPDRFEDLVALLALGRPGPMVRVQDYIERKHGRQAVAYALPQLEPVLAETYGVMLYQEQVMQVAMTVAGYSAGEADLLRRAMGKKKPEAMRAEEEHFVQGAVARSVPEEKARALFREMAEFAGYGFAKSHSAAYARITYQTAYMKAHHPVAFMAAQISSVMGQEERVAEYLEACREQGIRVLPPDVNASAWVFRPERGGIRFGLGAVKNVGSDLVRALVEAREAGPFRSLDDLLDRLEEAHPNRKALESLIKAGALDRFGHRRWLLAELDVLLRERGSGLRTGRARGQTSLFGPDEPVSPGGAASAPGGPDPSPPQGGAELPPFDRREQLALEKEALGFHFSGDPLAGWRERLARQGVLPLAQAARRAGSQVLVAGTVASVKEITTRRGEPMAFLTLADGRERVEAVLFPPVYQAHRDLLEEGQPVLISGRARTRGQGSSGAGEDVQVETHWLAPITPGGLWIQIDSSDAGWWERLGALLADAPGKTPVWLELEGARQRVVALLPRRFWIAEEESGRMAQRLAAGEGLPVRAVWMWGEERGGR